MNQFDPATATLTTTSSGFRGRQPSSWKVEQLALAGHVRGHRWITADIHQIRYTPPTRARVCASTPRLYSCRSIEWSSWLACLTPRPTRPWWSSTPIMRSRRSLSPRGLIVVRRENRSIPAYGLLTVSPKPAPLARCKASRHRRLRWRRAGSRYASRASATDVVAHRRRALGARAVFRGVRERCFADGT